MILEWIFNAIFGVVGFFLGLFPAMPSFDGLSVSIDPLLSVVQLLNSFVSLPMVGTCLLTYLLVCNAKFIWAVFMWVIRKIPGVS